MPARSTSARLQAAPTQLSLDDVLMCKDRSIGHDWPHDVVWEDGPDRKAGRTKVYLTYRSCRCIRCGTVRRETFVQDDRQGTLTKDTYVRYYYSAIWSDYERLTQAQIRHKLKKAAITAT